MYKATSKNTTIKVLLTILLVFAGLQLSAELSCAAKQDLYAKNLAIFKKSPLVNKYLQSAYGYALFPAVGKGGVGLGGGFGKGQVYRNGAVTGRVSLVQLSFGLQLGGQAFSEIIFFKDKRAYDEFTSGSFELDATASAVAVTAGVHAQAGTTGKTTGATAGPATGKQVKAEYVKGMIVFTHAKGGFMYEASIAGQKFTFRKLGQKSSGKAKK